MFPYDLIQIPCKLTLPNPSASEIKLPALATYSNEWFFLNPAQTGVIFKAPSLGGTTTNSSNTRSELRELRPDGSPAAWSTSVGVHSMECEFSVDALPYPKKPHVVTGQIHDGSDDVTVFRVEGNPDGKTATIWITNGNTTHDEGQTPGHKLTDSYKLGEHYRVGFAVLGSQIRYTFNGQPVTGYTQVKKKTGCYFKAGAYNQDGGDTTPGVYAQVTLYAVQVCHDGVCTGIAPGGGATVPPVDPPPVVPPVIDPPPVIVPPVTPPVEPPPVVVPPVTPPIVDFQPLVDALIAATPTLTSAVAQIQALLDKLKGLQTK